MNGFQNPVTYTSECLMTLVNELVFSDKVDRQYDDKFAHKGGQIGDTINVRRPARFTVSTGQALQPQDYFETSIPLVINNQKHIDTTFTSLDLTLKVEDFNERVVLPKIKQLANQLDHDGLQTAALVIGNAVGTPGTLPNNVSFITDAGVRLDDFSAPRDGDRYILLDQRSTSSMINALSGFFNAAGKISSQYNEAVFTDASNTLGFKFGMSQNVYRQTTGPRGGTPAVNGAGQGLTNGWSNTGTLVTNGWTAAAALRVNSSLRGLYLFGNQAVDQTRIDAAFVEALLPAWLWLSPGSPLLAPCPEGTDDDRANVAPPLRRLHDRMRAWSDALGPNPWTPLYTLWSEGYRLEAVTPRGLVLACDGLPLARAGRANRAHG